VAQNKVGRFIFDSAMCFKLQIQVRYALHRSSRNAICTWNVSTRCPNKKWPPQKQL